MQRLFRGLAPLGFVMSVLAACGGANAPSPLDLGGGIFLTVDGAILGATPSKPAEPDFLFATTEEWQALAARQAKP